MILKKTVLEFLGDYGYAGINSFSWLHMMNSSFGTSLTGRIVKFTSSRAFPFVLLDNLSSIDI